MLLSTVTARPEYKISRSKLKSTDMKNYKIIKWLNLAVLGLSLPLLSNQVFAQATNATLWTFATDGTGVTDLADSVAAFSWGGSTVTFDPAQEVNNNSSYGSMYVTANSATAQNMVIVSMFYPNSHPETGGHIYWTANPVDLTLYTNIEFDVKWDNTNSTRNLADFNSPPSPYGDAGIKFQAVDPNNNWIVLTNLLLPAAVTNGWVHMNIPINPTIAGISSSIGFAMQKYVNDPNYGRVAFWMENFKLDAAIKPLAPPTINTLAKPLHGLNTAASSSGLYDRHIGRLTPNTGKSWVGHATAANPVTYSFTVKSFPQGASYIYSTETLLFLIPNPTQNEAGAPDYNEANCIQIYIQQQGATNSILGLQYKVNEQNGNSMYNGYAPYTNAPGSWDGVTPNYYESGNLGLVAYNGTAVGKWSVKFTSDTNITLIAPDGTTNGLVIPSYNVGIFAESSGFNIYLGMQPNNAGAIGSTVAYSNFSVSNTVTPFTDNFLADTTLVTNWDVGMSPANSWVLVPASVAYSVTWTLPATAFSLEVGTNLANLSAGTSPSLYPVINGSGTASQFVDATELPAGNAIFFNLIKRTFTRLQILLPGETNAPGTISGKTGAPLPASESANLSVTVNAVDSTFHVISGVIDQINLTSSDSNALLPNPLVMANGTVTFSDFLFGTQGSQTITATDLSSTNIPTATSSSVIVGP